jgi:hypothetical protein
MCRCHSSWLACTVPSHCTLPRRYTMQLCGLLKACCCLPCYLSQILDLMGYEPSPVNKINIHVGGSVHLVLSVLPVWGHFGQRDCQRCSSSMVSSVIDCLAPPATLPVPAAGSTALQAARKTPCAAGQRAFSASAPAAAPA